MGHLERGYSSGVLAPAEDSPRLPRRVKPGRTGLHTAAKRHIVSCSADGFMQGLTYGDLVFTLTSGTHVDSKL